MPTEPSFLTQLRATSRQIREILRTYRALLGDRFGSFLLLCLAVLIGVVLDSLGIALVMPLVAALQGTEGASRSLGWLSRPLAAHPLTALMAIASLVAAVYLAKNLLVLLRTRKTLDLLYGLWQRWIESIVRNLLQAPVATYEREKPGALLSVALTHTSEATIGLRQMLDLFISLTTLLGTYVVLWILSWRATLVLTVALAAFALLVVRRLTRTAHRAGESFVRANKNVSATFLEIVGGIRYVKAYGLESQFREGMTRSLSDLKTSLVSAIWVGTLVHPLVETAVVLLFCGAVIVAARGASSDLSAQLPLLGVLVAATFRLFPILSGLGGQWVSLIGKHPSALAVLKAIAPTEPEPSGARGFSRLEEAIVFDRVSYAYEGRGPALTNVSLVLPRGSRTALVGESGSGKSTLVSLLLGFLKPHSGSIWIDSAPLHDLRLSEWRARLGYVGQEGFVFNATLGENVTLGRLSPSDPRVREALRATGLDEIVDELPRGLETLVGERGVELSGGQRQRVALARAIVLHPEILILDEATSALDNESAFQVQKGIGALLPSTTIVAVAHRLAGTSGFDRIFVLRAGEAVEEGTHAELMSLKGYYVQLFNHERVPEPSRG
jgi:ABC-type multidrug transport system fused ATPase/permease subunit